MIIRNRLINAIQTLSVTLIKFNFDLTDKQSDKTVKQPDTVKPVIFLEQLISARQISFEDLILASLPSSSSSSSTSISLSSVSPPHVTPPIDASPAPRHCRCPHEI